MKIPHKHAALIKAWADGATIQALTYDYGPDNSEGNSWKTVQKPTWLNALKYRIKPEVKTIKFRCYLNKFNHVIIVYSNEDIKENFRQWLGDWQEYTIEENTRYYCKQNFARQHKKGCPCA